ncbi:MAG: hypothetical protein PHH06_04680 [Candidatus Gracilibacteria bacterium]|nr:hypothetical protein [Candidatus Gracilibacteria bacterium]
MGKGIPGMPCENNPERYKFRAVGLGYPVHVVVEAINEKCNACIGLQECKDNRKKVYLDNLYELLSA